MSKTATKKKATKKPPTKAKKKATKKKPPTKKKATKKPEGEGEVVDFPGGGKRPSEKARAQTWIPGTEPERDEKLSQLADELFDYRTTRMEMTRKEKDAADRLIAEMRGKELEEYVDAELGIRVELRATDYKVKVKRFEPDEE